MKTMPSSAVKYPCFFPTLPEPEELLADIRKVFATGRITMGDQVSAFENDVCERLNIENTIAVSSGTSALMLLIRALNLPENSEVITPGFSFAATAHALLWCGLKPVFCDCEPVSFTMSAPEAEKLITERTSAIYPVCVFGVPGDIDSYQKLADKYGLALIFDSAQGIGSTYKGKSVGTFGAGEAFSMSPTKVVTSVEGGLITTNDDDLARQLRYMRDYGKAPDGEDMNWLGLSARMSEINAVIGRWSFARLDEWIENRTTIMNRYKERLRNIPGIEFQTIPDHCTSSRNYMVILLDPESSPTTRDNLHFALKQRGIYTKRYFYPAIHNQTLYQQHKLCTFAFLPETERISSRSLALPMYSHMKLDAVDEICDEIEAALYIESDR